MAVTRATSKISLALAKAAIAVYGGSIDYRASTSPSKTLKVLK
jgi:hypothetical protein